MTGFRAQADGIPVISKSPTALLDYIFDWATDGWLQSGETITSNVVTIDTGIANPVITADATFITVWLAGGTIGTNYLVTCKITTSAGRTDERSIRISVVQR
jgi:hypothetical protein